jgi:hypothetical protein
MKKILFALSPVLFLGMMSCSKKADNSPQTRCLGR